MNATTTLYTAIRKAIADKDAATLRELVDYGDATETIRDTNSWPYVRGAARRVIREDASTTWEERLDIARDAAVLADTVWYRNLDWDENKREYEAAKKEYRQIEREAFAAGFHWTCGRCGGDGRWVGNGGTCFNCGGSGFHPNQTPFKFEASPAIRAKREAKFAAEQQAKDAAFNAYLVTLPAEVAHAIETATAKFNEYGGYYNSDNGVELTRDESFAYGMGEKIRKYGSLSAKQIDAVQRGIDRAKKREAEAEALKSVEPLAEGRYAIEGEVLTTKWQESDYGTTLKMLVKMDDGNKVWGTVPRAIECDPKGERVNFTATVERSKDDEHFGFYKRPTGGMLVGSEGGQDAAQ